MPHATAHTSKKSATKQAAARRERHTAGTNNGDGLHREEMIAVAAYYIAEHRGFNGGDPVADWLNAEAEIDAVLNHPDPVIVH